MLYIIPTPIWNIDDITVRWLKLLESLNFLICEDTRTTKKLMQFLKVDYSNKKFVSFTSFTSTEKLNYLINMCANEDVGLVSEAGTPGISDPWKLLINKLIENNIEFTALPWATAFVPALLHAPCDISKFVYYWFLPQKKWRVTLVKEIVNSKYTCVVYESPYRIKKLVFQLIEQWLDKPIVIVREISKKFESRYIWLPSDLLKQIEDWDMKIKWEFVVII